ncbi:MAG TPA: hypothetical protein VNM14_13870 [Planctomycetota bacterium]|nr:hypothetical protein [Planctomycetota bacterium]
MTLPRSLALVLVAAAFCATTLEAQASRKASVVITAPADGSVLATPTTDVDVAFLSGDTTKNDHALVVAIELRVERQTVATFNVPAGVLEGSHRFAAVGLAPFVRPGQPVTLVARALLGTTGNRHEDSDPVRLSVQAGDGSAPQISGLIPAPGSFTSNPRPTISAQISDSGGSGLNPAGVALRLDGVLVAATVTMNGADLAGVTFTPTADLAEGPHAFTVDALDLAGNAAIQASSSFGVDRTPPQISALLPSSGTLTNNPTPSVSATVTDSGGSGVDAASIDIILNGIVLPSNQIQRTLVNANLVTILFTPASPLSEGGYVVSIEAADRAGNAATPQSTAFTMDLTPPQVNVSGPVDGQIYTSSSITVTADAADSLTGLPSGQVTVVLNGIDRSAALSITPGGLNGFGFPGSMTISGSLTCPDGTNVLDINATDAAGNSGTRRVIFDVNTGGGTPPGDPIILTKISGDGQTVLAGEAAGPLLVRASFQTSGAPAPLLTLRFESSYVADVLSSVGAPGPVTDSAGNAGVRVIPGRSGACVVTVSVLEDDTVSPVVFTVNAQSPTLTNVTSPGPCNMTPGTSEYPGSALPLLMKWKALKPDGTPLAGATVVARVSDFNQISPPPSQVGYFLPSSTVTAGDGTATFAFVIDINAATGPFTMQFRLGEYPDSSGKPVSATLGGQVRDPAGKPRNFGDTEIVFDDPEQSGQGQVGVPGQNLAVPLRARFFGASSGGGITFRIIEGDGTFEAGTEGDFVGFRPDDNCAKITGNIRATVQETTNQCRGNIRFKLAAGFTHALIAMDSFTDIFAVGPSEIHVVGPSGGPVKDYLRASDFRNLTADTQFKIQVYAPSDLQASPTLNVSSETASREALPVFPNDVAPTSAQNVATTKTSSNGRYGVFETKLFAYYPKRALFEDSIPTGSAGRVDLQGVDFGHIKVAAAVGPQQTERRVRLIQAGVADTAKGMGRLVFTPLGNQRDVRLKVLGLENATTVESLIYEFGDGSSITRSGADFLGHQDHTYTVQGTPRETYPVRILIHDPNTEMDVVTAKVRIANPVANILGSKGQGDLNSYQWNVGEQFPGTPPTRFAPPVVPQQPQGAQTDPFINILPPIAVNRLNTQGMPTPLQNFRLIYKAALPGDKMAGGTSKVFEFTVFDYRNYNVFGSFVGNHAWEWRRQELNAIINHHVKHVVDFNDARLNRAGTSGALIRAVYERYKVLANIAADNASGGTLNGTDPAAWDRLALCFDTGNGATVGSFTRAPHAFLELEPMTTQFTDSGPDQVSNIHIQEGIPQLIVWFNKTIEEFKNLQKADLAEAKRFVKLQYRRLLLEFPDLEYGIEFQKELSLKEPNF